MATKDAIHNPYVGPQPFQQEDQKRFFGRDREANELLSLVIANRFSLLYAQSGAGKTSLLNAKLFPMLREREFDVLPATRVRGLIPNDIPPDEVSNPFVYNTLISWSDGATDLKSLANQSIAQYLRNRPHPNDSAGLPAPRIIIFDQFEELFTAYPDRWKDRTGFFNQVIEALQGGPLFFRADHIKDPSSFIDTLKNTNNPLSAYLKPQFSSSMNELLENANGAALTDREQIAKELNRLIRRQGLFQEDLTAQAAIMAQTEELIEHSPGEVEITNLHKLIRANNVASGSPVTSLSFPEEIEQLLARRPRGESLLKLNRMLLEEAYPQYLPQTSLGDPLLRVLFVIREDFIAQLDPYLESFPNKLRSRLRLMRLQQRAALEAVKKPLNDTNRSFEDGVAERLVDELLKINVETEYGDVVSLKGEYVEPVQLQVVCENLWNDLPDEVEVISNSHVQKFGDVNEALGSFYEATIATTVEQSGISEGMLRRFFERTLLTPAGTRGTVYRGAQETGGIQNAAIDVLEDRHIIRGEWRGGSRWYELTHDRFIEPILRSNEAWLSNNTDGSEVLTWLEKKSDRWHDNSQKDSFLLEDYELRRAERWFESDASEAFYIDDRVRDFVNKSRQFIDANTIEKERKTKRRVLYFAGFLSVLALTAIWLWYNASVNIIKATTISEEADSLRGEYELLFIKAEGARGEAIKKQLQADSARAEAEAKLNEAEAKFNAADSARAEAEFQLEEALALREAAEEEANFAIDENQRAQVAYASAQVELDDAKKERSDAYRKLNQAISLSIADMAIRQRRLRQDTLAALLAKQAYEFDIRGDNLFEGQIYEALRITLNGLAQSGRDRLGGPDIYSYAGHIKHVAYSPDGKWMAAAEDGGTIRLLEVKSGDASELTTGVEPIDCLKFSPDGSELAVCRNGRGPDFWDFSDNNPTLTQKALPYSFSAKEISYSPDGQTIAFIEASGEIVKWKHDEVNAKNDGLSILNNSAFFVAMAASPDGKHLVAADTKGRLLLWNDWIDNNAEAGVFAGTKQLINTLAFSPDSKRIAAGSDDHLVYLWQVEDDGKSLSKPEELYGHQGPVHDVAFSNNGELLASGSADDTVHIRQINVQNSLNKSPRILHDHLFQVWSVAFSPDSKRLASGSSDETVRIWVTESRELLDGICKILPGQQLSEEEWDTFIGDDFEIGQYQKPC